MQIENEPEQTLPVETPPAETTPEQTEEQSAAQQNDSIEDALLAELEKPPKEGDSTTDDDKDKNKEDKKEDAKGDDADDTDKDEGAGDDAEKVDDKKGDNKDDTKKETDKDEKVDQDADDAEIKKSLSEKASARFNSLAQGLKEKSAQLKDQNEEIATLMDKIDDGEKAPEESIANVISAVKTMSHTGIKMYSQLHTQMKSTTPSDNEKALEFLKSATIMMNEKLGISGEGSQPNFKSHADLAKGVEEGDMTEDNAQEIAQLRKVKQTHEANQKQQDINTQEQTKIEVRKQELSLKISELVQEAGGKDADLTKELLTEASTYSDKMLQNSELSELMRFNLISTFINDLLIPRAKKQVANKDDTKKETKTDKKKTPPKGAPSTRGADANAPYKGKAITIDEAIRESMLDG